MLGFGLSVGVPLALVLAFLLWARGAPQRRARRPSDWKPRRAPRWLQWVAWAVYAGLVAWDLWRHQYAATIVPAVMGLWARLGRRSGLGLPSDPSDRASTQ